MRLNLDQRTSEWHKWRAGIIGASDIPVIMGISPFKDATPLNLWKEKMGIKEPKITTFAMQKGIDGEMSALEAHCAEYKMKMEPACFESDDYAFMGCSLDGITESGNILVEIKVPGKRTLELAKAGQIEGHYLYQVQYQLMITQAEIGHFYAYDEDNGVGYTITILPDPALWSLMVEAAKAFWQCIINRTPPGYILCDNNLLTQKAGQAYKVKEAIDALKKQIKPLEDEFDFLKEEIKSISPAAKVLCGDFRIEQSEIAGRVDYDRIELLKAIDLNLYRRDPISVFKIVREA